MITKTPNWKPVISILSVFLLWGDNAQPASSQSCMLSEIVPTTASLTPPTAGCGHFPDCSFEVCNGTSQVCQGMNNCRINDTQNTFCPGWHSNNMAIFSPSLCNGNSGSCASSLNAYQPARLSTEVLCSAQDESESLQFSLYLRSSSATFSFSVTVTSGDGTQCEWSQLNDNRGWRTVVINMPAFSNYTIAFNVPVTNDNNLIVAIDDVKVLPSKDRTCHSSTTETTLTSEAAPVTVTLSTELSPATFTENPSVAITGVTELPSFFTTRPVTETTKTSNTSTTQIPLVISNSTTATEPAGDDHLKLVVAAAAGGGGGLIIIVVAVAVVCKIKKRMRLNRGNIENDGMNTSKRGEETAESQDESRPADWLKPTEADVQRYSPMKPSTVVAPFYHNVAFHHDKQHLSDHEENPLQNEKGERNTNEYESQDLNSKTKPEGQDIEETIKRETDNITPRSSRRSKKKKKRRNVSASESAQYEDVEPKGISELPLHDNVHNEKTTFGQAESIHGRSEDSEIQLLERPQNDSSISDVYSIVTKHGQGRKKDGEDNVISRRSLTEVEDSSITTTSIPLSKSDHSGQSGGTTRSAISVAIFCETEAKNQEYSGTRQGTTDAEDFSARDPAHGSNQEMSETTHPDDENSVETNPQPNNGKSRFVPTAWSIDVEQYNALSFARPSEDLQLDVNYDHVNAVPDDMYSTTGTEKRVIVIDDVYNHLND